MRLSAFVGLVAGAAATSSSSNATFAVEKCDWPKSKVGTIHMPVYHIYEGGAGMGLSEKNAATGPFDVNFAFSPGLAQGRYYKGGYITKIHVGVTKWGQYLKCNHAPGSTVYSCAGNSGGLAGATKVPKASVDPRAEEPIAFSFPKVGKDKYWSEYDGKTGPCGVIRIKAKCLFNLWAEAGSCPKGCDGIDYNACTKCVQPVPAQKRLDIFFEAIDGGKCHRYETVEEELRDMEIDDITSNTTTVIV